MSQRWLNLVTHAGPEHPATCSIVRALADYADDKGTSWPSIATLATYLRVTERTVYRRLGYAERDGWIAVVSGGGRHKVNRYYLLPDRFSGGRETLTETLTETVTETLTRNPDSDRETLTASSLNPDESVTPPPVSPGGTPSAYANSDSAIVLPTVEGGRDEGTRPDNLDARAVLADVPARAHPRDVLALRAALVTAQRNGWTASAMRDELASQNHAYDRVTGGAVLRAVQGIAQRACRTAPAQSTGPRCHRCGQPERGHDEHAGNVSDPHPYEPPTANGHEQEGRASGAAAKRGSNVNGSLGRIDVDALYDDMEARIRAKYARPS